MKKQVDIIDATPHKRFILSIVSDYDLPRALCELIDNSIDIWIKSRKKKKLQIKIDFDPLQKTIHVADNAGGIQEEHLEFLISPGATTNQPDDLTIGIFGVGTKRAVIALSEDVSILSRYGKKATFAIEFDKSWLKDEDWHLPYFEVDQIQEGTTIIELKKLLIGIEPSDIKLLKEKLSEIYSRFLSTGRFDIQIDSESIKPDNLDNWAYPPKYEPRRYHGNIRTKEGRNVEVEVLAGLTTESSPTSGDYGVYFYCNDRLVVGALKSPEVGFIKGIAGFPHPSLSILRIIVSLKGAASDMPWSSSKSNINTNHYVFNAFRNWLLEIVRNYCSLSRRLEGEWASSVFRYDSGEMKDIHVPDFSLTSKSYLVELPPVNIRYVDSIKKKNLKIEKLKPWAKGLTDGIVAVDYILKQKIETKNRIALILLDSTLEIAFKEYLVNDSGKYYTDAKLSEMFKARHLVEKEMKIYISDTDFDTDEWKRIKFYYDLRCKLVHERATVNITTNDVNDQRKLVEKLLKILYNLKF